MVGRHVVFVCPLILDLVNRQKELLPSNQEYTMRSWARRGARPCFEGDALACYLTAMLPLYPREGLYVRLDLRDNSFPELPHSNHCSEVAKWGSYP